MSTRGEKMFNSEVLNSVVMFVVDIIVVALIISTKKYEKERK